MIPAYHRSNDFKGNMHHAFALEFRYLIWWKLAHWIKDSYEADRGILIVLILALIFYVIPLLILAIR